MDLEKIDQMIIKENQSGISDVFLSQNDQIQSFFKKTFNMTNTEETTKANLPQKTPQTNLRSMDSSSNQYGKESWDF